MITFKESFDLQETHRVMITVSDPGHPMVSQRKEKIQKTVRVKGDNEGHAVDSAIAHYKNAGYKVHDHAYIGTTVKEETMTKDVKEETIDEVSMTTLTNYKKKAGEQASAADKAGDFKKGNKRFSGIMKATKKQFAKTAAPKPANEELEEDGAPVNNVGDGKIAGTQGDAGRKSLMKKKPLKRFADFTK